jgi:hypothetical protein
MAFQDLQLAWLLQQNHGGDVSPRDAQQFERNTWDRLLRYLINHRLRRGQLNAVDWDSS